MARPKVRTSNGVVSDQPSEDIFCGYVMHQHKFPRCKMRWGQLWTGESDDCRNRCVITLFKFDVVTTKPGMFLKKDLKLKLTFEFNEEDFCGLEKGEHYTKNGMRRYICIILKDRHLIVQDAITAMTDTDHNVIGTWYRKITESMHYINRWKMVGSNDVKFFHLSRVNSCECFSLHNSHAGQKGKLLLDQLYRTKSIINVDEYQETRDGVLCSRVTFNELNRGMDAKMCVLVNGVMKLSEAISRIVSETNRPSLCPRFDSFNLNPNLVKLTPPTKKKETPPKSLKELSDTTRKSRTNNYSFNVPFDEPEVRATGSTSFLIQDMGLPQQGPRLPARDVFDHPMPPTPSPTTNRDPPRQNGIDPTKFSPTNPFVTGPRHHVDGRPTAPPRDPTDDPKKVDFMTQRSSDSAYLTGDTNFQTNSMNATEENAGLSIALRHDTRPVEYNNTTNTSLTNALRQEELHFHATPQEPDAVEDFTPPVVPPREDTMTARTCENTEDDLVRRALRNQNLPPIDTNPDSIRPGYENSLNIEVTIDTILGPNHSEDISVDLGLPYSVYIALILGLEKESVANGNWRGLASALHMSFRDVEQIESATQQHPQLYPAQIVLLHWQRTQAPYRFTRRSLKDILSKVMGRLDLAALIPIEENEKEDTKERKENGSL